MDDPKYLGPWPWSRDARRLARDAIDSLQLRRDLLELELRHDFQSVRRLVVVGGIGAVLVLTGLPTLLFAAAHQLSLVTSLNVVAWTLILAVLVILPGIVVLGTAIARFRREFSGLEHSVAEFQEDLAWLREWVELEETDFDQPTV